MAKATQKRWVCPNCTTGILAPSRMNDKDTRRYCLDCSKGSKRLVERTCPALDRTRKEKADRRRAKVVRDRERKAAIPFVKNNEAIEKEYRRIWTKVVGRNYRRRPPSLTIHRSRYKGGTSGHCKGYGWGIHITIGLNADKLRVQLVLLHEIVHDIVGCENGHNNKFRARYVDEIVKVFGVKVAEHGGHVYQIDSRAYTAIKELQATNNV